MLRISGLLQDLRSAGRVVRRDLRFHAPLVLLLALPVAACTVVAAALRGLILAPLPYAQPHELVLVSNRMGYEGQRRTAASAPELLDYRERLRSLSGLAAVNSFSASLTGWINGETYVWSARAVAAGRGEAASGLHFDATSAAPETAE